MSIANRKILSVLTRSLSDAIALCVETQDWERDPRIQLPLTVLKELETIKERWYTLEGFPMRGSIHVLPLGIVAPDASVNGAAAATVIIQDSTKLKYTVEEEYRFPFNQEKQQASSTLREAWTLIN